MSEELSGFANPKQLVALLKDADTKSAKIASINGELRERIAEAVENGKLHKKAFSHARAVLRMSEEKRNEYLRHMTRYLEIMEEEGLLGDAHVGDLAEMAREAEAQDPDEAAAEANAQAIEGGIKPLSDAEFDDSTSKRPSRRRQADMGDAPGSYKLQ
jgi:hypothetical protein